uniref:Uncharacterized protein n=1 Tax=viral metagenome TaxID=1070528 RepID=A0A6C0H4M1_9ZZZZ
MVHGINIKVDYIIIVDKELDKYIDIYPLCSKLRYDVFMYNGNVINMNYEIKEDRCNFPIGLYYAIDYDKDIHNSDFCYYTTDRGQFELKERNVELETVEKYADVLFYLIHIKKLSEKEFEEMTKMEIPLDLENGIEVKEYHAMKLKRIMKTDDGYFEEIKRMGEELTKNIKLTENEITILEKTKKELNEVGINVVSEEFKIRLEYY